VLVDAKVLVVLELHCNPLKSPNSYAQMQCPSLTSTTSHLSFLLEHVGFVEDPHARPQRCVVMHHVWTLLKSYVLAIWILALLSI
jgi:hypothetical protein